MIKFKRLTETAVVPERQTEGAAGFDIYSDHDLARVHFGQVVVKAPALLLLSLRDLWAL